MKTLLTIGLVLTALFNLVSCAPEPLEDNENCGNITKIGYNNYENTYVVGLDNGRSYPVDNQYVHTHQIGEYVCF